MNWHLSGWGLVSLAALATIGLVGCDLATIVSSPTQYEPNLVFAKRLEKESGGEMGQHQRDAGLLVESLFGTPDEPRIPAAIAEHPELKGLFQLARLQRAAGPMRQDENNVHYGIYRENCAQCHGITGHGRGATSATFNPYPRDFRMGLFKFKSTPKGSMPTRDDLRRTIVNGIKGVGMPEFKIVVKDDQEDLESMVEYVIFLSIRGQLERRLMLDASTELEAGDRLIDLSLKGKGGEAAEAYKTQLTLVNDALIEIAQPWAAADEDVREVELPGEEFAIFARDASSNDSEVKQRLQESIAKGQTLFVSATANCATCHGKGGAGDGQQNDYDDWTKDFTTKINIDPKDWDSVRPFVLLGALKPRNIMPRNLLEGAYRGGSSPEDIYRKIVHGIEGTPMPAAAMGSTSSPTTLSDEDVWHLVNYVMSLPSTAK
jgi:mono/diheme cytochrome c family protein